MSRELAAVDGAINQVRIMLAEARDALAEARDALAQLTDDFESGGPWTYGEQIAWAQDLAFERHLIALHRKRLAYLQSERRRLLERRTQ